MKMRSKGKGPLVKVGQRHIFLNRSFGLLWAGQTISLIGSHITSGGLQLVAVLTLGATPWQMSLLAVLSFTPALLVGLVAGIWVDRLPRRPILVVADLARGLLLLSIPLAAVLGVLRMEQIYLVNVLVGVFSVFFEVTQRSLLPTLLSPEQLMAGNSKLSASEALAEVVGPSLGGWLVQVMNAPLAILFDSASFLLSALCITLMPMHEVPLLSSVQKHGLWHEAGEGWRVLWHNASLRTLAGCLVSWNFCSGTFVTLYTVYIVRVLGFAPVVYGLFGAMAGAGSLVGALLMTKMVRRVGRGALLIGSLLLHGTMAALTPLLNSQACLVVVILLTAQFLGGVGYAGYFISEISLRQELVEKHFLGRINACMSVLIAGSVLSGSLLAGVGGGLIGIRLTLLLGSCGMAFSCLWICFSPLRRLRS